MSTTLLRVQFDFSYLQRQQAALEAKQQRQREEQELLGLETVAEPGSVLERPPVRVPGDHWYVLLLLDTNKTGHTNLIKTTEPQLYRPPTAPDSHAALLPPAAGSGNGAQQQQTTRSWIVGEAISVGSEQEADEMISRITTNYRGKKQVRGGALRGIRGNILATLKQKPVYAEHSALLGITEEQFVEQVRLVPYSLP